MIFALAILSAILLGLLVVVFLRSKRLESAAGQKNADVEAEFARVELVHQKRVEQEVDRVRKHYEAEVVRIQTESQTHYEEKRNELRAEVEKIKSHSEAIVGEAERLAQKAILEAQAAAGRCKAELDLEQGRIREHYETESRKVQESSEALVEKMAKDLEQLRKYEAMRDAEAEAKTKLAEAITQASALRDDAKKLLETAQNAAKEERAVAREKAREAREEADRLLDNAIKEAARIVKDAEKRAERIGGDAYAALRDKEVLDQAVKAIWNVINGYGDRYIIPTRSLLDELASGFGHTPAGVALAAARDQTRRMIDEGLASDCNYVEEDRSKRAKRFVTDAFNGRVDAILTRVKHDNYGTLDQEIRDAFSLVNLNGLAFRDARIVPAFLDSRLAELKWASVVEELKRKAREEQRRIQEQMREEEKVRREQERAIKEAQDKEEAVKHALQKARLDAEHANDQERAKYDARIAELELRLEEAEAIKQREISMAQLTRAGNVYIISNIGSFGEEVLKVGMTRRREPMERIWELGDASVPFEFDVHAMIYSEDAPALESYLHEQLEELRVNKVNDRKEFFRLPLHRLRDLVVAKGLDASFTMEAEAREYRETQALSKMTPEERERYQLHRDEHDVMGI